MSCSSGAVAPLGSPVWWPCVSSVRALICSCASALSGLPAGLSSPRAPTPVPLARRPPVRALAGCAPGCAAVCRAACRGVRAARLGAGVSPALAGAAGWGAAVGPRRLRSALRRAAGCPAAARDLRPGRGPSVAAVASLGPVGLTSLSSPYSAVTSCPTARRCLGRRAAGSRRHRGRCPRARARAQRGGDVAHQVISVPPARHFTSGMSGWRGPRRPAPHRAGSRSWRYGHRRPMADTATSPPPGSARGRQRFGPTGSPRCSRGAPPGRHRSGGRAHRAAAGARRRKSISQAARSKSGAERRARGVLSSHLREPG